MRFPAVIRLVAAAVLTVGLASLPSIAHAHTDFDFSLPTDGASVAEPLEEITVGFTLPVTLIGPGFRVLTPQGEELTPLVITDDDTIFRIQLDPPLSGGVVAVGWEVAAQDGHPLSGTFTFTVDADSVNAPDTAASTTPAPTTTGAAVVDAPPTTSGAAAASGSTGGGGDRTGLYVAAAAAVALGAGAFLVLRPNPAW